MRPASPSHPPGALEACRVCGGTVGFAWGDRDRPSLRPLAYVLEPERALRWGSLYRCRICSDAWYLDGDAKRMRRVPPERRALLDEWDARPLRPSRAHRDALAAIGATGRDRFGNQRDRLRIPCAIRWADETVSDPCLVVLTREPPLNPTWLRVRLFRDVAEVLPTDFALPPEVRCATLRAEELGISFAPTAVEGAGRRFLLNGAADLFGHVGVRGRDLRLLNEDVPRLEQPPVVGQPLERATVVVGSRYDGCEDLLLDCARGLDA